MADDDNLNPEDGSLDQQGIELDPTLFDTGGINPRSPDYPLRHPPTDTSSTGGGTGGGGTGSGSTTTSTTTTPGGKTDYTDDEETRFIGLPGNPEIWKDSVTGEIFAVFFAPDVEPPIPLLMSIPSEKVLKTYFGNKPVVFDREFDRSTMDEHGAILFGDVGDLEDNDGDPWAGFVEKMERARKVMPWLEDDEVMSIIGGAYLEGRPVEDWELAGTVWYSTHNEAQRAWMTMVAQDPASATQLVADQRLSVANEFKGYGAADPDPAVLDWIATKWASGDWSAAEATAQISLYTGGGEGVEIDSDFSDFLTTGGYSTTTGTVGLDDVRSLFHTWLGPLYTPDDAMLADWAGKFRDDPQGATSRLTEQLRGQRLALFPEYTDASLTYQDIASPWKAMASNVWGVPTDDMDADLHDIIRLNNANAASVELRRVGADRGYDRVVSSMTQGLDRGMQRGVRGAV